MRFSHLLIASTSVFTFTLVASSASAQDNAQATATTAPAAANDPTAASSAPAPQPAVNAAAPAQPQADKPKDEETQDDLKHVAITANPLSMALMRFGVNVEYLPVRHHGFILNPYFQRNAVSVGAGPAQSETVYTTFGGEVGYRFYTGNRGANGFFIGPAVFVQRTGMSATASTGQQTSSASSDMTVYGGIIDLGGQHVTKGGFTIGGGVGVMYLMASEDPKATSSTAVFSGVLPRFLLTAGYSF